MTDTTASSDRNEQALANSLDEISHDILDLMRRVRLLETSQTRAIEMTEEIRSLTIDGAKSHGRQLNQIREALIGEQKSLSIMVVFNAIVGALDQLRDMAGGLDAGTDLRTLNQLNAIVDTLSRVLRMLGFEEFNAKVDEPFDPSMMNCVGYEEGNPGVVIRSGRPGYSTAGRIVRPVSVIIAAQNTS